MREVDNNAKRAALGALTSTSTISIETEINAEPMHIKLSKLTQSFVSASIDKAP